MSAFWKDSIRSPIAREAALLLLVVAASGSVEAADTGYKTGVVFSQGANWAGTFTTGNLSASDDIRASTTGTGAAATGVLSTFGFGVPGGVTISGIEVQVEGSDSNPQTVSYGVDLSWNAGTTWTNFIPPNWTPPDPSFTGATDTTTVLGAGSLWGRVWSAAEFSDANFRLRIYRNGGAGNLRLDRIRLRVSYYSLPWPAGTMQVRTGSYIGNGLNGRAITGVGFQPDVIIVIQDGTCNGLGGQSFPCGRDSVIRTSTMGAGDISGSGYGYPKAPMQNRIQSLDADGFTVGEPPDHNSPNDDPTLPYHCVNHSGVPYYWTAFKAAAGEMELGDYVGDGTASRDIATALSFQPDYVLIMSTEGERMVQRTSSMPIDFSYDIEGANFCPAGCVNPPAIRSMLANGFRVGGNYVNGNFFTYHYVAWKATPGRTAVGQYIGNGGDNRSITGLGFRPEYVSVNQGTPSPPNSSTTVKVGAMGAAADQSFPYINYGGPLDPTNAIQALEGDGFQVGTALPVNSAGNTFYWVAFGPGSNPVPMPVVSGSYIGDGVANRAITVGFQPDLVIVDRYDPVNPGTNNQGVIRTSTMFGDNSKDMDDGGGGIPLGANRIQSLDPLGFTVGTDNNVNQNGLTYYWVAFKASPGQLAVGTYAGTGAAQDITSVGFAPAYVLVIPVGAQNTVQKSSLMPANFSQDFTALGYTTAVLNMRPDGFRVGTNPIANANGANYHYAAWAAVPGKVAVGAYVGGVPADDRNITGTGFWPEWVVVSRSSNVAGVQGSSPVHKPASSGVGIDWTPLFDGAFAENDNIQNLQVNGFQVGGHNRVNSAGAPNTYYWVAFGPHTPQINYRSIGTAADLTNQGTITVTVSSTSVTKTGGTGWKTANRGRGDRLTVGTNHYMIASVDSNDQLTLATPAMASFAGSAYTIARQFATLQGWEDCISRSAANTCKRPADTQEYFPTTSSSLVADDRREVGIAFNDATPSFPLTSGVQIQGSTTDASHTILLTADPGNRHNGVAGAGVVVDAQLGANEFDIRDANVTVEWLEFVRARGNNISCVQVYSTDGDLATNVVLQNLLVHDFGDKVAAGLLSVGIDLAGNNTIEGKSVIVRNTMIWDGDEYGIEGDGPLDTALIENVSIDGMKNRGIYASQGPFVVRNTIVTSSPLGDFAVSIGSLSGSNNTSSDTTAAAYFSNPQQATAATLFATPNANLHLKAGPNPAVDTALDLSSSFVRDIADQIRPWGAAWDRGADEFGATTTDLSITKDDFQTTAVPGNPITYAITVRNNGPDTVTSLTVTDSVPGDITGPAFTPSTGTYNSGSGLWTGLNLAPGQSVILTLSGTISPSATGSLVNTVTVLPPGGFTDPVPGNDSAQDIDTLTPQADLSLTKLDSVDPVNVGDPITYTLTVSNPGPSDASGVMLVDPLPFGVDFVSVVPGGPICNYTSATRIVSCNLGTVTTGSIPVVTITVTARAAGTITNIASVNAITNDPNSNNNTAKADTTVLVPGDAVPFFTVTSTSNQNVLEWLTPNIGPAYLSTKILYKAVPASSNCTYPATSSDGTDLGVTAPNPDTHYTFPHGPLLNDNTTYCYAAFVEKIPGSVFSVARFTTGRPFGLPFDTFPEVLWAYSTGASSMAPPGIGTDAVHAVSNDNALHSMVKALRPNPGQWPPSWRPVPMNGPSQGRPSTVPISVGGASRVVFLGSQDRHVYAFNADTGAPAWLSPPDLGSMIQAGPSGMFTAFGGNHNYILVGTRNGATDNSFFALDVDTGAVVPPWPFNGTGPTDRIGIISAQAAVDYPNHRVYFTSYARGGALGLNTVWCLDLDNMNVLWKQAYGDIATGPTLRRGRPYGDRLYVGTSTGEVLALNTSDGSLVWSFPLSPIDRDGPVKSFITADRFGDDMNFSTTNRVWSIRDNGAAVSENWRRIDLPSPSAPVFLAGGTEVYLGAGDGRLYRLSSLNGTTVGSSKLGDGLAAVGSPTIDTRERILYVGSEAGIVYAVQLP